MGDMYEYPYDKNSSEDEITLFLRQFLLRSSSSMDTVNNAHNSTSMPGFCYTDTTHENALPPFQDGISALDSTAGRITASNRAFLSASGTFTSVSPNKGHGVSVANVPSSSIGVSENDTDDYDCESEEGVEALAEEVPTNSFPSRTMSSSKRSRAAEVHNLSEKQRRRSRINEKLKALQNLIPNSNKTDKASMLEEAIEYLKQLQLQVQMLSMRNGLGLHPMCFPEGLYPLPLSRIRMKLGEENSSIPLDMTANLPQHQENPLHFASNLPINRTAVDQPSMPSSSYTINSETSLGESPIPVHIRPFQPRRTSEICGEDILQHQQLKSNHSDINPFGGSQD